MLAEVVLNVFLRIIYEETSNSYVGYDGKFYNMKTSLNFLVIVSYILKELVVLWILRKQPWNDYTFIIFGERIWLQNIDLKEAEAILNNSKNKSTLFFILQREGTSSSLQLTQEDYRVLILVPTPSVLNSGTKDSWFWWVNYMPYFITK